MGLIKTALVTVCLGIVATGAVADGLPAGTWDITWLEPRLTPASKAFKTQFVRCYAPAEAIKGVNPVMPREQAAKCKTTLSAIGGDIAYDTECGDVDHRLRLSECGTGFCGTYRYSARKQKAILEVIVILRPTDAKCERS